MTTPTREQDEQSVRQAHERAIIRTNHGSKRTICVGDGQDYPCATIRLLDAADEAQHRLSQAEDMWRWHRANRRANVRRAWRYRRTAKALRYFVARAEASEEWERQERGKAWTVYHYARAEKERYRRLAGDAPRLAIQVKNQEQQIKRLAEMHEANAQALTAARQAALRPEQPQGCPCLYVQPCSSNCTCASPFQSGGCARCARYGSLAQRRAAAERLTDPAAAAADAIRMREALNSIVRMAPEHSLDARGYALLGLGQEED